MNSQGFNQQMPSSNLYQNSSMNGPQNSQVIYNDKYVLNDDDKRKVATIDRCIMTCVSASSLPDRMFNKFSGKSTKDYRNMLIRRALLSVLKRQKEEGGLGSVSASQTFIDNTKQLGKVGYAQFSNMFSKKQGGKINGKSRKGKKGRKSRKSNK